MSIDLSGQQPEPARPTSLEAVRNRRYLTPLDPEVRISTGAAVVLAHLGRLGVAAGLSEYLGLRGLLSLCEDIAGTSIRGREDLLRLSQTLAGEEAAINEASIAKQVAEAFADLPVTEERNAG